MSGGPFTWKWVREHLVCKESQAINLRGGGCRRVAAKLNKAFADEVCKNERLSHRTPSGFLVSVPGGWSHGDTAFKKQRRWHAYAAALAEVMHTELSEVNPPTVDIGFSKNGPIVRALVDAIQVISGEHPRPVAIAKKLKRR
jgi:hypothetical protein